MSSQGKKIPTIMSAEELLDKAFGRSMKISKVGTDKLDGKKRTAHARINASVDILCGTLDKYVHAFPSLEKRQDFTMELVDLLIGTDRLKKSLGALSWCSKRIRKMSSEYIRKTKGTQRVDQLEKARKEYYGRVSSLIYQIEDELKFVAFARDELKKLPLIELDIPTVVVAGYPNVGKSQLVEKISTARPKIAPYPFTTQGIAIGHVQLGWKRFQVVDTPGLLDRNFEDRNEIEKQAILALKYLADLIVFVIDPSETSGYKVGQQLALLESVKSNFLDVPLIEVENKCDVERSSSERLKISAQTGEGVETLMEKVVIELKKSKKWLAEAQILATR